MLGVVGDEVVDVVATLPPADGETAAEVGDEHADEGVGDEVVGDASMASVVRCEHDLVLVACQMNSTKYSRCNLPSTSPGRPQRSCTIHTAGQRRRLRAE